MPFNWFKRQFGGKKDEASKQDVPAKEELKSTPDEVKPEPSQDTEEPADEVASAETTPANAEDYLQWAKAAYQNIQQQQTQEPETSKSTESTEPESTSDEPSAAIAEVSTPAEEASQPLAEEASPSPVEAKDPEPETPLPDVVPNSSVSEEENVQVTEQAQVAEGVTSEDLTDPSPIEDTPVQPEISEGTAAEVTVAPMAPVDEPSAPPETITDVSDAVESDTAPSVAAEDIGVGADLTEITETPSRIEDEELELPQSEDTTSVEAESDDAESEVGEEAIATALPFWAKAEAERQERLEKLKETAIEEPEEPEIELDEDFVWSAGVLASQGRKADEVSIEEITWLTKLRQGLGKTRRGLINELKSVVGQGPLNADAVMEIESLLLQADVGIDATDYVIEALQARMKEGALPPEEAIAYLKEILRGILDKPFESDYAEGFIPEKDCLNIWLLTGHNLLRMLTLEQ